MGNLNINSLPNKFNQLQELVLKHVDILVLTETKLDDSFPNSQFSVDGFSEPFRIDRNIELYKKAKYDASKLITTKKKKFFKEKLSETIGKPKELWESLKSLGMPNKTVISNFNAIEQDNTLTHDTRSISKVFKNLFSNLAESLLTKLSKPPDKYNLKSVI